jgi:proteasome assembly chaperone (PAC2) family protein
MWEKWVFHSEERIERSSMIVALSTGLPQYYMLYSQGRELAKFLLEHVENKKLASYYSSAMEDFVLVNDDAVAELPAYGVHRLMPTRSDSEEQILLFSGHSSPREETYEFCDSLLSTAKSKWGVQRIISIGTRWAEEPTQPVVETSKVYGFGGSNADVALMRKLGIIEHPTEVAPYFANIIVGMAPLYGLSAIKLSVDHGEVRPHPRQIKAIMGVLGKMLGFSVDVSLLDEEAEKLRTDVNLLTKNLGKGGRIDGDQLSM